ncbi:hypothetical protein PINS_up015037 [Pythium insidiosum]|nr:hypothetical protein PINS_up015037 [Pythium insidiosum]
MEHNDIMQVTVMQSEDVVVFESTQQGVSPADSSQDERALEVGPELVQNGQPRSNGEDAAMGIEVHRDNSIELHGFSHQSEKMSEAEPVVNREASVVTVDAVYERGVPDSVAESGGAIPDTSRDNTEDVGGIDVSVTTDVVGGIERDVTVRFEKDDEVKPDEEPNAPTPNSPTDQIDLPSISAPGPAADVVSMVNDSSHDPRVSESASVNDTTDQVANENGQIVADDEALADASDQVDEADSSGFFDGASVLDLKDIGEPDAISIEEVPQSLSQVRGDASEVEDSSATDNEDVTNVAEEASLTSHTAADAFNSEDGLSPSSSTKSNEESDVQFHHEDDIDLQDLSDLDVDALLELADLAAAAELQRVSR